MSNKVINLKEKLGLIKEVYSPKGIASLNDYVFKLAKVQGDFIWHEHPETDEAFFVISGTLFIEMEETTHQLNEGELFVVKKGEQHRPFAREECSILLIEPKGTINTGTEDSDLRLEQIDWI